MVTVHCAEVRDVAPRLEPLLHHHWNAACQQSPQEVRAAGAWVTRGDPRPVGAQHRQGRDWPAVIWSLRLVTNFVQPDTVRQSRVRASQQAERSEQDVA